MYEVILSLQIYLGTYLLIEYLCRVFVSLSIRLELSSLSKYTSGVVLPMSICIAASSEHVWSYPLLMNVC